VIGLKTVAEFVDQPRILAKVREMGIDYAQGFLVHRPAPINELLAQTATETGRGQSKLPAPANCPHADS
jgi:EAL domain-containing protein (putative c-di-GMP-specific phosphodiesterase class I)